MTVTASLIKAILGTISPCGDVNGQLAMTLESLDRVESTLSKIRAEERAMTVRHARERAEIEERMRRARKACPHYEATYHGDPAGGSDSSRTCNLCGDEV